MTNHHFVPQSLVGRQTELQQVAQILRCDGDLLIAGVAGSGRRTLVKWAAHAVGAKVLTIDCLRATDGERFLQLWCASLLKAFAQPEEQAEISLLLEGTPVVLSEGQGTNRNLSEGNAATLLWEANNPPQLWQIFQLVLALPQKLAEQHGYRVVVVLHNFTHIRSWDRKGLWEGYLRQEIKQQSCVSYALIATVTEPWMEDLSLEVMVLAPIPDAQISQWVEQTLAQVNLVLTPEALTIFLQYIQGNVSDGITLMRRIWLQQQATCQPIDPTKGKIYQTIHVAQVHNSMSALLEDLSPTFESLVMLLPPSQVRVLESLAIDPTISPHSREYIQKHQLSKGGSLQGALESLEQKGLVYGAQYGYRIALPMLCFWLRHRLS
ncbi:MAG: ATP-binding protein [Pseudanabaena sp. ELA607]|jgi:hypothetical protein